MLILPFEFEAVAFDVGACIGVGIIAAPAYIGRASTNYSRAPFENMIAYLNVANICPWLNI